MTKGVLFDMDGVLLHTEELKALAHSATVHRFGGSVSPHFYRSVMGHSQQAVQSAFTAAAGCQITPDEYAATFRAEYLRLLNAQLRLTAGARELVTELRCRGYGLALVTSSLRWMVGHICSRLQLEDLFHAVVCADDIDHEKPAPDAYLRALSLLGLAPSAAIVMEDSEAGVLSGVAAGVRVIALRHEYNGYHDFSMATGIIESLLPTDAALKVIESLSRSSPAEGNDQGHPAQHRVSDR